LRRADLAGQFSFDPSEGFVAGMIDRPPEHRVALAVIGERGRRDF
jgi:hypothetical protein